ncbi:hypothetical protein EW026_g332 [Hermanssonia centrifuga]|uniref:Metallo-beta-lactamase domain-containing protein n=1 Tax=Hermanssonia centrifuga TaxID=98765 RepID=A0A4S4KV89_9APHY|nr:hypothetical protein EW026_g332 [Hermanssonia centrifuga]
MKGTLHDFKAECDEDVVDMLHKDGIEPEQINQVIYSHLHFDHVGDPTPFTAAEIVLGADAQTLLADSYPTNQDSYIQALPANRKVTYLDFSVSASHKYKIVSPIGTFDRAIDFYDDGSLYFVDSPGHSPGHIAALARVAPNNFVFLAGDTCHNRECYVPGTRLISEENYADLEMARETVTRLVRMNKEVHNVVTILAHEAEREQDMPQFPVDLKEWAVEEIQKRKAKTGGVEA